MPSGLLCLCGLPRAAALTGMRRHFPYQNNPQSLRSRFAHFIQFSLNFSQIFHKLCTFFASVVRVWKFWWTVEKTFLCILPLAGWRFADISVSAMSSSLGQRVRERVSRMSGSFDVRCTAHTVSCACVDIWHACAFDLFTSVEAPQVSVYLFVQLRTGLVDVSQLLQRWQLSANCCVCWHRLTVELNARAASLPRKSFYMQRRAFSIGSWALLSELKWMFSFVCLDGRWRFRDWNYVVNWQR